MYNEKPAWPARNPRACPAPASSTSTMHEEREEGPHVEEKLDTRAKITRRDNITVREIFSLNFVHAERQHAAFLNLGGTKVHHISTVGHSQQRREATQTPRFSTSPTTTLFDREHEVASVSQNHFQVQKRKNKKKHQEKMKDFLKHRA